MTSIVKDDFTAITESREGEILRLNQILASMAKVTSDDDSLEGAVQVGPGNAIRRISCEERKTLIETCRCTCADWSRIFLIISQDRCKQDQSSVLQQLVSDTNFDGFIVLDMREDPNADSSTTNDWECLFPGVHSNLMICDSIIELRSCRIYRNNFIGNTFVKSKAVIISCGFISVSKNDCHIYGELVVSVGAESGGGRKLHLTSQHTMIDVCKLLQDGSTIAMSKISPSSDFPFNVIGCGCVLRDTSTIHNVYLHENSSIIAASSVSKATLFPKAKIGNSSTVNDVILQWDTSILDNSNVSETLLMEQAHCGPNSIVASTVLGPDVHVSAGEVHASVIGPNTNSHHQSLLIGILWPLGRGNVGYGANVGSNHTGRLPDQETAAGEGTFWGLSNIIKFPVDLSFSPYSIIAAGTTLPPQRLCMPFSLVLNQNGENELIPGWVLQSSPYTLVRSEKKYATRRKAKRHSFYTGWKIFRQDTIEMCRWSMKRLEEANNCEARGIGPNKLTPRARHVGIQAYKQCMQRYALHGLLKWILGKIDSGSISLETKVLEAELAKPIAYKNIMGDPTEDIEWPVLPWSSNSVDDWKYQIMLLQESFPIESDISSWVVFLLRKLVDLEKDFAFRIQKSKARDDRRGEKTIPGYALSHVSCDNDPVITEAFEFARETDVQVNSILSTHFSHFL